MQPGEGHLEQRYTLVAQDAPRCSIPERQPLQLTTHSLVDFVGLFNIQWAIDSVSSSIIFQQFTHSLTYSSWKP